MTRDEAQAEIRAMLAKRDAEIARCHERLEIDHITAMGEGGLDDLVRRDVPMSERANMADGIAVRDAIIAALEEDVAELGEAIARTRAAFVAALQADNECDAWLHSSPCRKPPEQCECAAQMEVWIEDENRSPWWPWPRPRAAV